MFQRFHEVKGFTYSEVLICYALVLVEFSLAEMFARGFDSFSGMVRHAEFDRVLVRPRNEVLQMRTRLSGGDFVYIWRHDCTDRLESDACVNSYFYADRRSCCIFRIIYGVCSALLFYT